MPLGAQRCSTCEAGPNKKGDETFPLSICINPKHVPYFYEYESFRGAHWETSIELYGTAVYNKDVIFSPTAPLFIVVWSAPTNILSIFWRGKWTYNYTLPGRFSSMYSVLFSPNGRHLAMVLWDAITHKKQQLVYFDLNDAVFSDPHYVYPGKNVSGVLLTFSLDSSYIGFSYDSFSSKVGIYSLITREIIFTEHGYDVSFLFDNCRVIIRDYDDEENETICFIYEFRTHTLLKEFKLHTDTVIMSPTEPLVLIVDGSDFDLEFYKILTIDIDDHIKHEDFKLTVDVDRDEYVPRFLSDGLLMQDKRGVFDPKTGECLLDLRSFKMHVSISPDKRLIYFAEDNVLYFRELYSRYWNFHYHRLFSLAVKEIVFLFLCICHCRTTHQLWLPREIFFLIFEQAFVLPPFF